MVQKIGSEKLRCVDKGERNKSQIADRRRKDVFATRLL